MRIMMLLIIAFSMLIMGQFTPVGATDSQEPCQAIVTEVKGICYIHQEDSGQKRKIAVGDCLLADQRLQCSQSAQVKIKFCITGAEKAINASYQVPKVPPLAITDPDGSIGGRPMGGLRKRHSRPQVPAALSYKKAQPSCEGQ